MKVVIFTHVVILRSLPMANYTIRTDDIDEFLKGTFKDL